MPAERNLVGLAFILNDQARRLATIARGWGVSLSGQRGYQRPGWQARADLARCVAAQRCGWRARHSRKGGAALLGLPALRAKFDTRAIEWGATMNASS